MEGGRAGWSGRARGREGGREEGRGEGRDGGKEKRDRVREGGGRRGREGRRNKHVCIQCAHIMLTRQLVSLGFTV